MNMVTFVLTGILLAQDFWLVLLLDPEKEIWNKIEHIIAQQIEICISAKPPPPVAPGRHIAASEKKLSLLYSSAFSESLRAFWGRDRGRERQDTYEAFKPF